MHSCLPSANVCYGLAKRARALESEAFLVVRIPIPIDVGTIAATACSAFAAATPLRVDRLVGLAVREVLGARAPQENRDRTMRAALAGMRAGRFVLEVDGRRFNRPEAVVVASGSVTLRFFLAEAARPRVHA